MKINRHRPFSSLNEDIQLKNKLRRIYLKEKSLQKTEVDIILPTFNRSKLLLQAVKSVSRQIHQHWKLYICDDGSTDDTAKKCNQFDADQRIQYINLPHKGVSAARNSGIKSSKNRYIAFIDSDNTWSKEYLSLMIAFITLYNLDSAFCAARLVDDHSEKWLGDVFNWEECLKLNYIDLNCFMTTRGSENVLFDEKLFRLVDWDYILGVTKYSKTSFLPAALVRYCNRQSRTRITTTINIDNDYMSKIRNKHKSSKESTQNLDSRLTKKQASEHCDIYTSNNQIKLTAQDI